MREDMAKVIVERPRQGGGYARDRGKLKNVALEDQPKNEPMKYRHGTKQLNENLKPLYRWLEAQAGRNWNKVHSELRERIDVRSAVQAHIWQHAEQYVERRNVQYIDKVPHAHTYRGAQPLRPGQLYVCPKTNLLKKNGTYKRSGLRLHQYQEGPAPDAYRRASPTVAYIKHEGIWYELTLAKLSRVLETMTYQGTTVYPGTPLKQFPYAKDVFLNLQVHLRYENWMLRRSEPRESDVTKKAYGDGWVYCTRKRQMNSKEIRQAEL